MDHKVWQWRLSRGEENIWKHVYSETNDKYLLEKGKLQNEQQVSQTRVMMLIGFVQDALLSP